MQQELIEMLEKVTEHIVICNNYDQRFSSTSYGVSLLNEAEKLVEKAKNGAKEPAVPVGLPLHRCTNCQAIYQDQPPTQCDCMPDKQEYEAGFASFPSTPAPSQPVTEQETLVGLSIHGKELRNENIVYDGGPLDLTDCKLLSCYIEFSKAAARTVQFLAIAEQSQPGFLQPLFADAVRLAKPSQEPVTLTDSTLAGIQDRLVSISGYVADQDDRAAQAILKETLKIIDALREKAGK